MKIKDKHCICKKWKEEYLEAIKNPFIADKSEAIVAQNKGLRCPFCDKELAEKERKVFVVVQFPPVYLDKPSWDCDKGQVEHFVSLKELKHMLKESK